MYVPTAAQLIGNAKTQLPQSYINYDQQSASTSWPHLHVEQGGISTVIRRNKVYRAQLHINSAVYQPRSAKRRHTGAAIYQQRSEHESDSTAGRHGRDCQSGIFTAISKTKAHLAQLFIANAVNQLQSATQKRTWCNCISTAISKAKLTAFRKLKRNLFWTTQPCRPEWCINRDQFRKSMSGAAVYH